MFEDAWAFNGDISSWNTCNVVDLSSTFNNAWAFNSDISAWNTSKMKDIAGAFEDAFVFNVDISKWNTSSLTGMSTTFSGAESFNVDIGSWNVATVRDMDFLFENAYVFDQDVGNWNVSNVLNMQFAFFGAREFSHDLAQWNTMKSISMEGMFEFTKNFDGDISEWQTKRVRNMNNMFYNSLNEKALIQRTTKWDTSGIALPGFTWVQPCPENLVRKTADDTGYRLYGTVTQRCRQKSGVENIEWWVYVLVGVGAATFVCASVGVVLLIRHRRRAKRESKGSTNVEIYYDEDNGDSSANENDPLINTGAGLSVQRSFRDRRYLVAQAMRKEAAQRDEISTKRY